MRIFTQLCLTLPFVIALSGCASLQQPQYSGDKAIGYRDTAYEECVPYARRVSGINIRGNAYTWWDSAAGVYARGSQPHPNAVLVFSRSNKLRNGHLAVVTRQLSAREIDVTHRNWGNDSQSRRIVFESQRVQDISPYNNWTSVRLWNPEINAFGLPYPTYGFIYGTRE